MSAYRIPSRRALAVVSSLALTVGALAVVGSRAAAATDRPTAIVSLGDSEISGEGAGDYDPGTDGPDNFCHRSEHAQVHETSIPDIDRTINLACSGATTDTVRLGGTGQYGEPVQTERLRQVARDYDVRVIAMTLGANDDPSFADVVLACITAWANPFASGCRDTRGPGWPGRVEDMEPAVAGVVDDVRSVMRDEGYADDDYQFVLESYASPVTEHMNRFTHALEGCPLRLDDANWGRTEAVPELSDGLRAVAERTGVRFLDMSRATENHEACNDNGLPHWQNGLVIDLSEIPNGLNEHIVQQTFHPTATGQAQIAGCVTQFVGMSGASGRCVAGPDGNLRAEASAA